MGFLQAYVEDHAFVSLDSVQEAYGGTVQLRIFEDVLRRVQRRAFLLPEIRRNSGLLDFKRQQIALQPIEIGSERANAPCREHESTEPEYRAGVVLRVRATDDRPDMTELIQIRNVERTGCARETKARAFARASKLEQARVRVRPRKSVENR
jgi:hypothetical protein